MNKNIVFRKLRRIHFVNSIVLLLLSIAFSLSNAHAQGWGFTITLTTSGPCGTSLPSLPTFSIPYMSTQGTCESLRQTILDISASQPMYDNQGNYIGTCSVFYTATPCSGADISTSSGSEFGIGDVSIDGLLQGTSFFSPHETRELESWMNDYIVKLQSMGITVEEGSDLLTNGIPLTGNAEFDAFYADLFTDIDNSDLGSSLNTDKPLVTDNQSNESTGNASEEIGTTVQLLTTSEEQRKRDEWMEKNGLNNATQIGVNNAIDEGGNESAEMSWSEALLREYAGNNVAGSFSLKVLDGVTSGTNEVVQHMANNDMEGASEIASGLAEKVAINSAISTAQESVTSLVTGVVTAPVLGLVKGAETVTNIVSTGINLWNTKHGK